jgi:hypothetical protein
MWRIFLNYIIKMKHFRKYYIITLCILFSCQNDQKEKANYIDTTNSDSLQISNSLEINDWKKDKHGCSGLRTLGLARELIIKNELLEKSKETFYEIFGKPDEVRDNETNTNLTYYIEATCEDGKLIKNVDKCWMEFYFKNGLLIKIPEVFVCE